MGQQRRRGQVVEAAVGKNRSKCKVIVEFHKISLCGVRFYKQARPKCVTPFEQCCLRCGRALSLSSFYRRWLYTITITTTPPPPPPQQPPRLFRQDSSQNAQSVVSTSYSLRVNKFSSVDDPDRIRIVYRKWCVTRGGESRVIVKGEKGQVVARKTRPR